MERVIPPSPTRNGADRCPGLLRPHLAADGAVVRVRLPGGMITAAALAQLSAAADHFANGELQLTSRANLQLRGVPVDESGDVPDVLVDAVRAAGLLPSDSAELVRNIVCSPMTGRLGGFADLRPLAGRLDALLCGSPALAALPGRFLFGLDDGSGDIAIASCDLGVVARPDGRAVLMAGGQRGPVVELEAAVDALATMALSFLDLRRTGSSDCWHVAELPGGGAALLTAIPDDPGVDPQRSAIAAASTEEAAPPRFGAHRQVDGRSLLSLVVPLGRLTSTQVQAVVAAARLGSGDLVITPWNALIIPDLPPAVGSTNLAGVAAMLADAGLPSTADSGWIGVSACTGAPGCARGAGPTAPVATRIAHLAGTAAAAHRSSAEPVHVVACERRCGAPAVAHREVMIELTGQLSRRRPARTDDGRTTRRTALPTGMSTDMSTAVSESA